MEAASSVESLPKSYSGGALKLLDGLDELASLLGTDISKPRPRKSTSVAEESGGQIIRTEKLSPTPSNRLGELFSDALSSGRLSTITGNYQDGKNTTYKLADALDKDIINADSVVFVHPDTQEVDDILQAISQGYIQKTGHYLDRHSGKRLKLKECLERNIIVARDIIRRGSSAMTDVKDVVVPPLNLEDSQVVEVTSCLDYL